MNDHGLLSWYEAGLSSDERKKRGHFSTPPLLIEKILDACGYTAERDLTTLRVLDPACGSGNFLVAAARRLLLSAQASGDEYIQQAVVERNIWGLDPDPVACFLADMQLRTALAVDENARFHIHQADGLTLPWQQGEHVDLLLANPPYLAAKNTDLSGYRSTQQRGQSDSYLLFLDLALHLVRPNGWIGLVLPDPVLARANATRERQRLLRETSVRHLWHLSGVFSAVVGAVVIIAQKSPPPKTHVIAWQRGKWQSFLQEHGTGEQEFCNTHKISQTLLLHQQRAELRYLLPDRQDTLLLRLHTAFNSSSSGMSGCGPLGELVSIRRGEELGKDNPFLLTEPLVAHECYPVLRGGVDVHAYMPPVASCWIAQHALSKPLQRYVLPKLLVVKSTEQLEATLDVQGHVVLQTLYLLHLLEQESSLDELYFLLALLNSRLLRDYVYFLYTAYKLVQPQIEQHVLASLPIPRCPFEEKRPIIENAKRLFSACGAVAPVVELKEQKENLYEEQERSICLLYEKALLATYVDVDAVRSD